MRACGDGIKAQKDARRPREGRREGGEEGGNKGRSIVMKQCTLLETCYNNTRGSALCCATEVCARVPVLRPTSPRATRTQRTSRSVFTLFSCFCFVFLIETCLLHSYYILITHTYLRKCLLKPFLLRRHFLKYN